MFNPFQILQPLVVHEVLDKGLNSVEVTEKVQANVQALKGFQAVQHWKCEGRGKTEGAGGRTEAQLQISNGIS